MKKKTKLDKAWDYFQEEGNLEAEGWESARQWLERAGEGIRIDSMRNWLNTQVRLGNAEKRTVGGRFYFRSL